MVDVDTQLVRMFRIAFEGSHSDLAALARRTLTPIANRRPDLQEEIRSLLNRNSKADATRAVTAALPVDTDSRLELLRREIDTGIGFRPVWTPNVDAVLQDVVSERQQMDRLRNAGVEPTKSLLFQGLPGTGKSLAARWLADQIKVPLLTLDLSAVMSSFLGRTGNNIRAVLDYARQRDSVLLLDEFDAVAKRRDDSSEVGELKRLVTVLLQEIEQWPNDGLLIAATNHPGLLDPAVWRRFDRIIEFPIPTQEQLTLQLEDLIGRWQQKPFLSAEDIAGVLVGSSFADVARYMATAKRTALVRGVDSDEALVLAITDVLTRSGVGSRLKLARGLSQHGVSQRRIRTMTGLSRDTLRRHGIGGKSAANGD